MRAKRMTPAQWDTYLSTVLERARKRLLKLEAAKSGDVRFRTVRVESYRVRAYTVSSHTRVIEDRAATRQLEEKKLKQRAGAQLRVMKGGKL